MDYVVHSLSCKSPVHSNNEDDFLIGDDYVIIADGMGGERDGEIASRVAVNTVAEVMAESLSDNMAEAEIRRLSFKAIEEADNNIMEYVEQNPESCGMGTTMLLSVVRNGRLFISWCGDSRCYSYRKGRIRTLTKDHSYVQQLIDAGKITEKESYTHPDSNLITRFVGGGEDFCIPEFESYDMAESNIIIMCSDGLSGYCKMKDIEKIVASNRDVSMLPDELMQLALRCGSDDDVTVVVLVPKLYNPSKSTGSFFGWFRRR